MEFKELPLFSRRLREILDELGKLYESKIINHLITADVLSEKLNWYKNADLNWRDAENLQWHDLIQQMSREKRDSLVNDEIRMLDIREKDFTISFLPEGKEASYSLDGKWERKNRQDGKPTKIIKKLIGSRKKIFSDAEYEVFNNQLRSFLDSEGDFKIVTGSEISYWYDSDNYYEDSGNLGDSCMRDAEECNGFFEIYENYAEMLILVKEDKLLGRAILWNINGKTYMDRVYTIKDYLVNSFKQYAEDHKWFRREHNSVLSNGDQIGWYGPWNDYDESNDPVYPDLIIKINEPYKWPYLDSFRYYDKPYISTKESSSCITTDTTSGELDDDYVYCECECCGVNERVREGDDNELLNYSSRDCCYYCNNCGVYSHYLNDFIRESSAVSVHKDIYTIEYNHEDEVDYTDQIVRINDEYYDIDYPNVAYNEETNEYYLKDEE